MTELRLKLKINGYSPISINQDAFNVASKEVTISREDDIFAINIKFDKEPTCLCGSIINCEVPFEVTELYLPESINKLATPLGWLNIKKSELFSINKNLLSSDGNLIIYKDKVVRQIGEAESIIIPEGITVIGESAFEGKKELSKVNFPTSIIEIERSAFRYCWNLPIKFPKNLEVIGDYAFERCGRTKESKIIIPAKVKKIGNYAFKSCSEVTSVKIGKSVTEIGQGAFAACDRIASFEGKGSEKYGTRFLVWDKRLISVAVDSSILDHNEWHLPEDIEEIGDWAITYEKSDRHWTTLRTLPSGLKRIGNHALYGITTMYSTEPVIIPDTVEEIGEGAFSPEIRIAGKYVSEDGVLIKDNVVLFKNFTKSLPVEFGTLIEMVPEYSVPEGVTRIGNFANILVEKLILPEGLVSVGENAIHVSKEITLPSTLRYFGGIKCNAECKPLTFPKDIVSVGTSFSLANQVSEINLLSNPPIFYGSTYGKALIVVSEDKFSLFKEAYSGIIDERGFPNGRIAYKNSKGELCYE